MKVIAANYERGANETRCTNLSAFVRVADDIRVWTLFDSCPIRAANQRGKFFSGNGLLPDAIEGYGKGYGCWTFSLLWHELKLRTNAVLIQRLHTIIPSPIPSNQTVLLIVKAAGDDSAFDALPNIDTIASN